MAGDWIKMRSNLWDDPRVSRLCDLTDQGEATVIGGLYWLWAAADQHTETGVMTGLSLRQIDRKTGIAGFGQSLCDIGWIAECEGGVCIVNFEEHNGASAKRRTLEAKRKADARKASARNADNKETETGRDAELEKEKERELEKEKEEKNPPKSPKGDRRPKLNVTVDHMLLTCSGLSEQLAGEYLAFRKSLKAPLTESAWKNIAAEIAKSNASPDDALSEAMAAGWRSFKAQWLENRNAGGRPQQGQNPGPRKELRLD